MTDADTEDATDADDNIVDTNATTPVGSHPHPLDVLNQHC